jgi:ATP/maltotriose-dependent transcriptional regulator MalT
LDRQTNRTLDQQLGDVSQLLEAGRTGEAERLLRQLIPKPEEEAVRELGIFSVAEIHDLLWALTGYSYAGAYDYANAERVAGEMLRAVDARGTAAAGHLPIFLTLMAEVYRLQGKHAAAYPLYARLNRLWFNDQLPADFQKPTELGFVECSLVRGDAAAAESISRPPVDPDGSYVGPSFHEHIFNMHVVAMEEAGHKTDAAQFEAKTDAGSRRPPAANQQDRDLLRARLLSARGQDAAAEAIYRKWTGYWKTPDVPGIVDPKESLQIRTVALVGYGHFLSVHGRTREAQAVQSRLAAMGCRFGMCE